MKRLYELTDGDEVFSAREMTDEEFEQASVNAKERTGGNVFWTPAPTDDFLAWLLEHSTAAQDIRMKCGTSTLRSVLIDAGAYPAVKR